MLKDLFEEKKPKKNDKEDEKKKALMYLCVIFVCFALLFVGSHGENKNNSPKNDVKIDEITVKKEDLISKLDLLKDNYEITVYKVINDEEKKLEINGDEDLTIYYGNALNVEGYIDYKGNIFIPSSEEFKRAKKGEVVSEIPSYIYDFELLKKITSHCTFKDNNTCEINISDYLNEYNDIYKTSYKIDEDKKMSIKYEYNTKVDFIEFNASEIEKIINKSDQNVVYSIFIDSINANNFESQIKYFEDLVKKNN